MANTKVSELTANFRYSKTQAGITVVREFAFDPDSMMPDITPPCIGDVFTIPSGIANIPETGGPFNSSSNVIVPGTKVYCRSQETAPMAGHPGKLIITCSYTNEPCDINMFIKSAGDYQAVSGDTLPKNIEYSGEYVSLNPISNAAAGTTNNWTWLSDGTAVVNSIPYRVNTTNVKFTRYVATDYFAALQSNIRSLTGCANRDADPIGAQLAGGIGCWLFTGAQSEQIRNAYDILLYKVDLDFSYRNPDNTDSKGWQKLLTLKGIWDQPQRTGSVTGIYQERDFSPLFGH